MHIENQYRYKYQVRSVACSFFIHSSQRKRPAELFTSSTSDTKKENKTMIVSKNLKLVAAGRGRSMSLPSIAEAVVSLISATTTSISFVYLGTATYDKEEAFLIQTEAYRNLPNCQMIKLDVSEAVDNVPSEQEIRDAILSAHAIIVSGGNTLYAVNRWKELKIDQFIRQAVEENQPVLCGGSAGAICWFEFGHSDSMDPTTFLHVDPNLTEEQKSNWEYIR
jgi:dipeptidase E